MSFVKSSAKIKDNSRIRIRVGAHGVGHPGRHDGPHVPRVGPRRRHVPRAGRPARARLSAPLSSDSPIARAARYPAVAARYQLRSTVQLEAGTTAVGT